jgi:hypothetical protein
MLHFLAIEACSTATICPFILSPRMRIGPHMLETFGKLGSSTRAALVSYLKAQISV